MCHAFGTLSTSGYSPKNAGIGYYDNAYFDWVIILFMFLGGVNFILFYQALSGDLKGVKLNTEFRWYGVITLIFCVIVSLILWWENTYGSIIESLRYGFFQVVSLLTTTGFGTADYEQWPQAAQMFLYTVCFVGPSAGSTGSGIKIVYFVIS
jgi:trk system potassium uptake protein TrkH